MNASHTPQENECFLAARYGYLTMHNSKNRIQEWWLNTFLLVLAGYAVLGKSFEYMFIGEIFLVIGFMLFLRTRRIMLAFSDPVLLGWTIFAFWGICLTIPNIPKYRVDAVRDAALWGYGAYALVIIAFLNSSDDLSKILNKYRKFLHLYLPALPVILLLSGVFRDALPHLPWAPDVSVVMLKSADASVHLCAAALFLLLFPDSSSDGKSSISISRIIGICGWFLAAIFVIVRTRGGLLAMTVPLLLVSLLRMTKVGWKVAALAATGIFAVLLIVQTNLVTVKIGGRAFTMDQISENVGSIAGADTQADLNNTKTWRLLWWKKIVNYTVFGRYFWTGKGFGINLATVDGPSNLSGSETEKLRSPHNGTMTVLARMGVPGLTLWLAINLMFGYRVFVTFIRAERARSRFWSSFNLWILCYWLSSLINSSFDVYLEGPAGGIWFWSIIGFGTAALRIQTYEAREGTGSLRRDASTVALNSAGLVHI
jgi:hypothetical protein